MNTKIMIIDAHPVYGPKVAGFLESLTFKNILLISSGIKALETIAQHNPEIIILSSILPDMDSLAVARQIKSQNPSLAIIVQAGLLMSEQARGAFKLAGVEYVVDRREKDWSAFQGAITDIISSSSEVV